MSKIIKTILFIILSFNSYCLPAVDIVFITQTPNYNDFATVNSTFANHLAGINEIPRGGDLYIRYKDGSLKNLTKSAGYGSDSFQGANAIAVRDPSVHWEAKKIIFSMVIGSATQQYQTKDYYWQLYEISNLEKEQTPIIKKVLNQPENFNNIMPIYSSDDQIIFISDRPRNGARHLYPQRDEYESTASNTGIWKLNPNNSDLVLIDHAPSGDFDPILDSYGRVIFTRWDHLQRDQQAGGLTEYGAFNYSSEAESANQSEPIEIFPEARNEYERQHDQKLNLNLHSFNHFFPWMVNQDGTGLETLNHIGRHELHSYFEKSFLDDLALEDFFEQALSRFNKNSIQNLFQIKESVSQVGSYFGINAPEFGTHASGQIVKLNAPPGLTSDQIQVKYITHPSTASISDTPDSNHSGLYRDPLELSDHSLIAAHTSQTRADANQGNRTNPISRYDYRIKILNKNGEYFSSSENLTSGIIKNLSWFDPDELVSYHGYLWELQPVELLAKQRPVLSKFKITEPEKNIFNSENVSIDNFQQYLIDNQLALIVVRNSTSREISDQQQPYNLKVPGGVRSINNDGKHYLISDLQILQANQVRGYFSYGNLWDGRRIIAQIMEDLSGINLQRNMAAPGSVEISEDGSIAALVPANRALTWQLLDPDGKSVVKERYWLTFQPGEIRACGSCHGVNSVDQTGKTEPQNEPEALRKLLNKWKGTPYVPKVKYEFLAFYKNNKKIIKSMFKSGKMAFISAKPINSSANNQTIKYKLKIGKYTCRKSRKINILNQEKIIKRKIPNIFGKHKLNYKFYLNESLLGELNIKLQGQPGTKTRNLKAYCNKMI